MERERQPRKEERRRWERIADRDHPLAPNGRELEVAADAWSVWRGRGMMLISALEQAEYPTGGGTGPQWHVSVSMRSGRRCSDADVAKALDAFGLVGAEEDNHHPGVARHFWMPLDPARRVDCECKDEEITIADPDGYRWTTPWSARDCRGCELQTLTGRPCPLHTLTTTRSDR
jgi:hypothetical protein